MIHRFRGRLLSAPGGRHDRPVSATCFDRERPVRVSRGVWLPTPVAMVPAARLAALLRALPPGTALSGRTAAALHGLWVPAGADVDVTVPASAAGPELTTGPRRRGVRTHRRALSAAEVQVVGGLPVTTAARTWYDLAGELPIGDLVAAGDSALRAGLVGAAELAAGLQRRRGLRGTARARLAVPLLDAASRSRPESHLRAALVLAGLPRPAVNAAVHDATGQWLAEPDLSYAAARLAVEYQGSDHAGSSGCARTSRGTWTCGVRGGTSSTTPPRRSSPTRRCWSATSAPPLPAEAPSCSLSTTAAH